MDEVIERRADETDIHSTPVEAPMLAEQTDPVWGDPGPQPLPVTQRPETAQAPPLQRRGGAKVPGHSQRPRVRKAAKKPPPEPVEPGALLARLAGAIERAGSPDGAQEALNSAVSALREHVSSGALEVAFVESTLRESAVAARMPSKWIDEELVGLAG